MTSDTHSFPQQLTKVDEMTRFDHHLLREGDVCYFPGNYTARKGFGYSAINKLIINFKKPMDRKGSWEWRYKEQAISQAAGAFHHVLRNHDLSGVTFVPVPPSKAKSDPLYDDRMLHMLVQLSALMKSSNGYELDVRELVTQEFSRQAAHDGKDRPSPAELAAGYSVAKQLITGVKAKVVICDDVLTTGSHFRAMSDVLALQLGGRPVIGLFLARREPETDDFSAFYSDE
jgi:hypothetical protein